MKKNFIKFQTEENSDIKLIYDPEGQRESSASIEVKNYDYIFTNAKSKKPHLLCNESFINSSDYTFIHEEKEISTFDTNSDQEHLKYDYDILVKEKFRYFSGHNPTKKCFNCAEFGHYSLSCPNEKLKENCFKCGSECHKEKHCPNFKCFRCHKKNHRASECKEKNLIRCKKCKAFGHESLDCLSFPEEIKVNLGQNHCFLCNSLDQHQHEQKMFLLNQLRGPILETCPKCAGGHNYSECPDIKKKIS